MIPSLPNEEWKPVEGYEGYYEVSNHGRIKALSRTFASGKNYTNVQSYPEKIMKLGTTNRQYKRIGLRVGNKTTGYSIHRLVAIAFIPRIEGKDVINHKDGNGGNNHVSNLEWCTYGENLKHAYDNGLRPLPYGGKNNAARSVVNTETGIFYDTVKEACDAHNISYQSLVRMLNGNIKNNTRPFRYAV